MGRRLLIIGASGHGKVAADIAIKMNHWSYIDFVDDNDKIKNCMGIKVIGNILEVKSYLGEADIFVAIGDNQTRKMIQDNLKAMDARMINLIHPSAVVATDVSIGLGTIIMAGVVVNSSTKIGSGAILNTSCSIDHDNVIGDYVHVSPGVRLGGSVSIGQKSWIGIGSTIINNVKICRDCIIGAGSLVLKDIQDPGIYYGSPVKLKSSNK